MLSATVFGSPNQHEGLGVASRATAGAIGCKHRPINYLLSPNYELRSDVAIVQFAPLQDTRCLQNMKAKGKKLIAYWVFESTIPFPDQLKQAHLFDQIWTPSTFCQEHFAKAGINAKMFPHPMQPLRVRPSRGIRNFAVIFNSHSGEPRKNPSSALLAFARAFRPEDDVHLTLKGMHMSPSLACAGDWVAKRTGLKITTINEKYDDHRMEQLWQKIDCLVSLHRSEGFGLHIAEAMMRGIPTIATNYSGSTDFTKFGAYHVDYDLIDCDDVYFLGGKWASPKIDDAAMQMQLAHKKPTSFVDVAAVREYLSPELVGAEMRRAIAELEQ